jgi:hypothetical protein
MTEGYPLFGICMGMPLLEIIFYENENQYHFGYLFRKSIDPYEDLLIHQTNVAKIMPVKAVLQQRTYCSTSLFDNIGNSEWEVIQA